MIREIHKRPFARPLLLWITGVVLQTYGSFRALSFVLLLPPALFLLLPLCLCRKQKPALAYENRWVWGALFSCLLLFLSIQLTAYHETRSPPPSSHQWARHIQQTLTASFDSLQLTEEERAVLSTITLGDRSHISREVRQQFSLTGVAHILSVSGFHVAIVCGFLFRLLSFFPANNAGRWIRYLLTLLSLWLFVDISGMAVASIRAGIMLSLYLTAKHLGRKTDGYNTLAASAFCMLVYDPFYLYDIGFQLSYTAVGFILYLQPRLSRLLYIRNPILRTPWEWMTLTLAAQTGVTFLCLYYFGNFSTVFLFTNLPLALIATLLIPTSLLWLLLPAGFPFHEFLQGVIEVLVRSMMWIVDAFSRIPGSSLSFRFDGLTMWLCYGALLLLMLYNEQRRPRLLHISLFLVLLSIVHKGIYLFL